MCGLFPGGHHLCLAGALSEAKPPEIDAKSDVSAGIIKSAHDDSLSGNNERGGKQPVGIAALNPRKSRTRARGNMLNFVITSCMYF